MQTPNTKNQTPTNPQPDRWACGFCQKTWGGDDDKCPQCGRGATHELVEDEEIVPNCPKSPEIDGQGIDGGAAPVT